ncbi:DUF6241 domain-containing protein [Planococcus sp. CAU13]|uniref:DUF6241 domain-containing protein n=1 Tax=Planococcus sp. CAU13 TaxID=1541197 RepID=UPI00052FF0DC|nr:DUF6241 domain-containing protein [Planococcus sp. CAU13]
MKSILKVLLISVVVLAVLGGAGYWFVQSLAVKDEDKISAIVEELEQVEDGTVQAASGSAKETEELAEGGLEETQLQTYLHRMTHQKVTADKKFGAIEMSEANISNLLKIVEVNYNYYEHSEFYEEMLTAWQNGNFSNAVNVHNTIWKWHNGNVGRATGLMTPEQEAEYVEKHFR